MVTRSIVRSAAIVVLTLGGYSTALAHIGDDNLPDLTPSPGFIDIDGAPQTKPTTIYKAVLNGGQTVPPSPSTATGVAYLAYYKKANQLCYHITYTPLEGNEVDAHLHAGAVGEARVPFLINLPPFPSTIKTGCVDLGVVDRKDQKGILKLLGRGQTYINVHSDLIVDGIEFGKTGEIRGQVIPVKGVK
jgi:hypothetical protein